MLYILCLMLYLILFFIRFVLGIKDFIKCMEVILFKFEEKLFDKIFLV